MAKTHYGSTPRGGYLVIYFTEDETRQIADNASTVASIIKLLVPEPHFRAAVSAAGFALKLKAKRCLAHDKCLAVLVAGVLAIPREYTPGVDDIAPTPHGYWS